MATKAIKLNYLSAERFIKDYERLCTGKIFHPTKTPVPLKTRISLNLSIPDIEENMSVEGGVVKIFDAQTAAQLQKPSGMLVGLVGGPEVALKELNEVLSSNTYYRMLLNLTDSAAKKKPAAWFPIRVRIRLKNQSLIKQALRSSQIRYQQPNPQQMAP